MLVSYRLDIFVIRSDAPVPDISSNSPWHFGPMTCSVVALFVVADLALLAGQLASSPVYRAAIIGLAFGQVGAAVTWAMAPGKGRRWKKLLGAFFTAAAIGGWLSIAAGASVEPSQAPLFVTIFLTHAILTALLIGVWKRAKAWYYRQATSIPRFGVMHLLVIMSLVALASTVVRRALPELEKINFNLVVAAIAQSALLALLASELLLARRTTLGTFSVFLLGAALLTALANGIAGDFEEYASIHTVQVGVLALAVILPQLDARPSWRPG